ncbi:hypothetical protein P280DRAFT_472421 [Massarina eburnea CBS 473.64]|uniref:Uncharacterized protein n=1 Tax=Massarina eburnea CBS 473.64 TaxID=1395130 RepID=A0A6A6RPY0_9PLEO|nr:hypothetical protein P280DRAFT_472421 [Massarina eburnea CBS 473.64]
MPAQYHPRQFDAQTSPPKHSRTFTTPEVPTLSRLPSSSSLQLPTEPRPRRETNPSTPALTQLSSSSTTSPSYSTPQTAASTHGLEHRSSSTRRPPASFSGHGIDTSRGPPITLITRGNSDIARWTSQQPPDFGFAQPFTQRKSTTNLGLLTPDSATRGRKSCRDGPESAESVQPVQTNTPALSSQPFSPRLQSTESSEERSPHHKPNMYSRFENSYARSSRRRATHTGDGPQEDLFLNIAADSATKEPAPEAAPRTDRLKSRIARATRMSFPSVLQATQPNSPTAIPTPTTNGSRIPAAIDTKASQRRASLLPSRTTREPSQSPLTPSYPPNHAETPRIRAPVSPKPSFIARRSDSDLSPREFLASLDVGKRRPSYPDISNATPQRANGFRPSKSNLHYYSSSRDHSQHPQDSPNQRNQQNQQHQLNQLSQLNQLNSQNLHSQHTQQAQQQQNQLNQLNSHSPQSQLNQHTPQSQHSPQNLQTPQISQNAQNPQTPVIAPTQPEVQNRVDETESHGSTGPASVWDELDELKTRIRRIEMGGKIPATASAAISQATAERPRTANTSVTTASSSPNQQRKPGPSPAGSTVGVSTPNKVHPLLGEALAKAKQHMAPTVYRVLEATASEALALAEMTGSGGLQSSFHSNSSTLAETSIPDRQFRRKADNICRSLTELCIALCENKPTLNSPAFRSIAVPSRRTSLQVNGDSPTIRRSIEPESNSLSQSSPSTAMSRIEARRVSMLNGGAYSSRENSLEPPTPSQSSVPTRITRTGSSQLRNRQDEDDDPTLTTRTARTGTSLRRSRQDDEDEDPTLPTRIARAARTGTNPRRNRAEEEDDDDPTLRAPSRAYTDFRDTRSAHKTRFSREYTSREPLPNLHHSTSQHATPLRRPAGAGIAEPRFVFGEGSRRFGIDRQGPSAYDRQASAEPSPRSQFIFSSNRNSVVGLNGLGRNGSLNRKLRGKSAGE